MLEVVNAIQGYDSDPSIGAIVLTGSEKASAAGADIKEMQQKSFMDVYKTNIFVHLLSCRGWRAGNHTVQNAQSRDVVVRVCVSVRHSSLLISTTMGTAFDRFLTTCQGTRKFGRCLRNGRQKRHPA